MIGAARDALALGGVLWVLSFIVTGLTYHADFPSAWYLFATHLPLATIMIVGLCFRAPRPTTLRDRMVLAGCIALAMILDFLFIESAFPVERPLFAVGLQGDVVPEVMLYLTIRPVVGALVIWRLTRRAHSLPHIAALGVGWLLVTAVLDLLLALAHPNHEGLARYYNAPDLVLTYLTTLIFPILIGTTQVPARQAP